jgi:glycosyltransferase involved in cell wall biosynthesis
VKIVHLTSAHPRYDARIFLKECRTLAESHDVALIVADGKGDEFLEGVRIIDVGKPRGRMDRMMGTVGKVLSRAIALDADAYHLHDPELLRIAGRLRGQRRRRFVIFDAHEDLPRQIMSKQWLPRFTRPAVSKVSEIVEEYVVSKLSGVVTATPHIAQRFSKCNGNVVDVNNYPMLGELGPAADEPSRPGRQVCYIGGLTRARGIEAVVRALPLVPDVKLVLCGSFQESSFEGEMRALPGWSQVDYKGHVGRAEVRRVLAESMAGIVTLLPTPAYLDSLPVKMFEYMSAELAVIASDFPLWRDIIHGAGAGVCVDPHSPEAIAGAIRGMVDDPAMAERMGRSGSAAVREKYNWTNEAGKLCGFYADLAKRPTG